MKVRTEILAIVFLISVARPVPAQSLRFLGMNQESPLIAAVVEIPGRPVEVWLNPREHWLVAGTLADGYTEIEQQIVDDVVQRTLLCRIHKATFRLCKPGRTAADLRRDLEDAGVEIDPKFQAWAQGQDEP